MGKSSSSSTPPPAPNYKPIAQADTEAAKIQAQTAHDQLEWSKEQFNQQNPATMAYLQQQTDASAQQTANAQEDRDRYKSIYAPMEDQFAKTAAGYNSADRSQQASGAAQADVASGFGAQRSAALSALEGYGIDPSQTRFGALDLGTRVSQAAATAAAGTGSRLQTEATGLGLQTQAIGMGRGIQQGVGTQYAGAANSGQSGINTNASTDSTYSNMMGGASTWSGLSNASNQGAVGALGQGYNNQMDAAKLSTQQDQNESAGYGQLIGTAATIGVIAI